MKEKVAFSFSEVQEVQEISQNHSEAMTAFESLEMLQKGFPDLVQKTVFLALAKKIGEQKKYFGRTGLMPAKALSNLDNLKESSRSLLLETKEFFKKSFLAYLEKNTVISAAQEEVLRANQYISSKIKVAITNSLKGFAEKISLKIAQRAWRKI
ncbi:MAG: hypothetical protein HYW50_01495 [Candidatus Diapherotrites archaeon]|nr:hypothetical protein [Candidatus Diapherotrites archaeon]